MNIALPAMVALALLAPGFAYHQETVLKEHAGRAYARMGFVSMLLSVSTWSCLVHLLLFVPCKLIELSTEFAFDKVLSYRLLFDVLAGSKGNPLTCHGSICPEIGVSIFVFLIYIMGCIWLARFIGQLQVKARENDQSSQSHYTPQPWTDLFSAYEAHEKLYITFVTEIGGNGYVYIGMYEGHEFDSEGKLSRIVLSNVWRDQIRGKKENLGSRQLSFFDPSFNPKSHWQERYYHIDAHRLVAYVEQMKNLAFRIADPELDPDEEGRREPANEDDLAAEDELVDEELGSAP